MRLGQATVQDHLQSNLSAFSPCGPALTPFDAELSLQCPRVENVVSQIEAFASSQGHEYALGKE